VWGKLKDFLLRIPVDETITPIIHPIRWIPYHLRENLDRKLTELVDIGIIDGSSSWISQVVVVPKKNGDIRLCGYTSCESGSHA
jgi:hypothetical protein